MTERRRMIVLALILIGVAVAVGTVMTTTLYRASFDVRRADVMEVSDSRARLIKAVAAFQSERLPAVPDGVQAATLAQMRNVHAHYFEPFGVTGEFLLARRSGDEIDFLLRYQHPNEGAHVADSSAGELAGRLTAPANIPWNSPNAEPMRRALLGASGTMVGLDYEGHAVLAAYKPVGALGWGVVSKVEMAEIRAPFVRAGLTAFAVATMLTAGCTLLFLRITNPLIMQLAESRARLDLALQSSGMGTWSWNIVEDTHVGDARLYALFGVEGGRVEESTEQFYAFMHPDDAPRVRRDIAASMNPGVPYESEYRVVWPDGSVHTLSARGQVHHDPSGRPVRMTGVVWDVTDRERAAVALQQSAQHLRLQHAIAGQFLSGTMRDVLRKVTAVLLEALHSANGFIGYLDGDGNLVIDSQDESWWSMHRRPDGRVVLPREMWGGLWGRALTERRALYKNADLQVPAGHVPLANALVAPILNQDRLVGVVALGNTATPYDDADREQLEGMAAYLGPMLHVRLARAQAEEELQRIAWLLSGTDRTPVPTAGSLPAYGDLTSLNTVRVLLDGVGETTLQEIASEYVNLLGTSSAVYEANGDYAMGMFASNWCRYLDDASRRLCGTADNRTALACGRWHCHESCWTRASKVAIDAGAAVDIECDGGIRLFAVPIQAGDETIGSINFGYGDPPQDPARLRDIAARYGVPLDELRQHALAYESRPAYIIALAKSRLWTSARLLGEIVNRRRAQDALRGMNAELEHRVHDRTASLEVANRKLEGANVELEQYAHVVSHDLKAPLRAMHNYATFLYEDLNGSLQGEQEQYLDGLMQAVEQGERLVEDLLALSQVGQRELALGAVDLVAELRAVLPALECGADVDVILPADPVTVCADPTLLRQLFQNLLANALTFNTAAHKRVDITWSVPTPDTIEVRVQDNGIGIAPRHQEQIFGMFQRLHTQEEYPGTGIGLAIVRRAAHRLGGTVRVESAEAHGATFIVVLPRPPEHV